MKKFLIALLSGSILLFTACESEKAQGDTVKTVKTDTVKIYGENKSVSFPGKLVAASDINLAFRISGPIAKVYAEVGRYVKKGQVLAEIDSRDYVVQLSATEYKPSKDRNTEGRLFPTR